MSRVVDGASVPPYGWGERSEGRPLLDRQDLSVILERAAAGDGEQRHVHGAARQFFYLLAGEAVLEVEGVRHHLGAGQGLEVPPGAAHQFRNESATPVTFLVISSPRARGDRRER